jgi:aldehyde:ferredoxin oxidoreductase
MGSKRLKAVAIADRQEIKTARPERIKELNQEFLRWLNGGKMSRFFLSGKTMRIMGRVLRVSPIAIAARGEALRIVMRRYGTIVANVIASQSGDSPVKNWKGSGGRDYPIPSHAGKLDPDAIIKHETRKYHCYACPLGCGGIVSYQDSRSQTREAHKPEYETCAAFGSLLLNNDPQVVFEINDLLNRAGMDTISAGGVVAFAIECAEHGLLTPDRLDGLKLAWGNAEAILALVRKIIAREGIGDLLADGVRVAAQKIGPPAADFAMHAGGQELPMHDTRYDPGFALAYSLDPTPGRHNTYSIQ